MSRSKPAHITINGTPICECEQHGLLLNPMTYTHLGQQLRISCGYHSKARARSAWREIAKHRYWRSVKVVDGHCPASRIES